MDKKAVVGALDEKRTNEIMSAYEKDPKNAVVRHALSRSSVSGAIFDSASLRGVNPKFSLDLKTMPVANQRQSGRCWIFAGLNFLREIIGKKAHIKSFELSQNYISLYDKIEKANYALELVVDFASRDHDDREYSFILHDPVSDGGQWDMFVDLVKKYGLMPQSAFPETYNSNSTRETDALVSGAIREFASKSHALSLKGKTAEIRKLKEKTMDKIYALFLNAFGVPPKSFDFEYENDKGKYVVEAGLTPLSFFQKYIGDEIDDYQSIINSPTADKPFMKNYTIDYLGNVLEGKPINHLNLPMERIKELIVKQLQSGLPVWFGSDVGYYRDRDSFSWNDEALDYESEFGLSPRFDKGEMLIYWHSAMNHAMLVTGANIVNDKVTKWKIENSWGDGNGVQGYYVMSPGWFDSFVYQAVINKKFLSDDERKAAAGKPVRLHPWDPMGTLAD